MLIMNLLLLLQACNNEFTAAVTSMFMVDLLLLLTMLHPPLKILLV